MWYTSRWYTFVLVYRSAVHRTAMGGFDGHPQPNGARPDLLPRRGGDRRKRAHSQWGRRGGDRAWVRRHDRHRRRPRRPRESRRCRHRREGALRALQLHQRAEGREDRVRRLRRRQARRRHRVDRGPPTCHARERLRDRAEHLGEHSRHLLEQRARSVRRLGHRQHVLQRQADHQDLRVRLQRMWRPLGSPGCPRQRRRPVPLCQREDGEEASDDRVVQQRSRVGEVERPAPDRQHRGRRLRGRVRGGGPADHDHRLHAVRPEVLDG